MNLSFEDLWEQCYTAKMTPLDVTVALNARELGRALLAILAGCEGCHSEDETNEDPCPAAGHRQARRLLERLGLA